MNKGIKKSKNDIIVFVTLGTHKKFITKSNENFL